MVRGGTGPLRAVMDAADRVADGDYTVRVARARAAAVRALAYAFNAMTERLAHADRQRRDLMADVAPSCARRSASCRDVSRGCWTASIRATIGSSLAPRGDAGAVAAD